MDDTVPQINKKLIAIEQMSKTDLSREIHPDIVIIQIMYDVIRQGDSLYVLILLNVLAQ